MKFLFWLVVILLLLSYSLRLFLRYGLPWLLGRMMKNQQEKFNRGFYDQQDAGRRKNDGEVNINIPSEKAEKKDTELGEYIDFEEVDE